VVVVVEVVGNRRRRRRKDRRRESFCMVSQGWVKHYWPKVCWSSSSSSSSSGYHKRPLQGLISFFLLLSSIIP